MMLVSQSGGLGKRKGDGIDMHEMIPSTRACCVARNDLGMSILSLSARRRKQDKKFEIEWRTSSNQTNKIQQPLILSFFSQILSGNRIDQYQWRLQVEDPWCLWMSILEKLQLGG